MAVDQTTQSTSSIGRRFFFGTNVLMMIAFAAFIVIGLNFLGQKFSRRTDLTGGFGSAQLSERTEKILDDLDQEVRISTVYASDEPDKHFKEYLPKLRDLCDEMARYSDKIEVEHLRTGEQRQRLRDEIKSKYKGTSEAYAQVIKQAETAWDQAAETLGPYRNELTQLVQPGKWLAQFAEVVNLMAELNSGLEQLADTRREVQKLVDVMQGIPKYKEANEKIKQANDTIRSLVEQNQDQLEAINDLVTYLATPDADFIAETKVNALALTALAKQLTDAIGQASDNTVPEDPRPTLQKYARVANELIRRLADEQARVEGYLEKHPELKHHPMLRVQLQQNMGFGMIDMGTASVTVLLSQSSLQLSEDAEYARAYLAASDVAVDQIQGKVRQSRGIAAGISQYVSQWSTSMVGALTGTVIDDATKDFLARAAGGEFFKQALDQLTSVGNKIEELPELELDELANQLNDANIVVIEMGDDVKIVKFDEVWPESGMSSRRRSDPSNANARQQRLFVGDAAISSSILSLQHAESFATIVFVGYEPLYTPQANPMMPQQQQRPMPIPGALPMQQFDILKSRFEQANCKTETWNMATEEEPPVIAEGQKVVYVFLPPANMPRDPRTGQPIAEPFGPQQLQKVQKILADNGRAIFLATWERPQRGMPTGNGYADYLRSDWGIEIEGRYRLIRADQDRHDPERYAMHFVEVTWMPLNDFNPDHPIGNPLRSRRVLMYDTCPLKAADDVPTEVTLESVLEVPADMANKIWAIDSTEFMRIQNEMSEGDGTFKRNPENEINAPFSVVTAAGSTRTNSKIVVMGTGMSPMSVFLESQVPQIKDGAKIEMGAPPTEVIDLYLNTVYWLAGMDDFIAAGPTDVPVVQHLDTKDQQLVRGITMGWAVVVLLAGGLMMFARRK